MKKVVLSETGLNVSKLCFGTGRFRKYLSSKDGGELLKYAFKKGVNFWDTSDNYDSHRHVKEGLKGLDRKKIVIMSKISEVWDKKKVSPHVNKMLKELGTGYIDILLLHAVDSEGELEKYLAIIPELKKLKEKGKINHIGISSHKPNILWDIIDNKEIEFVLAPYNYRGFRIKGVYHDILFKTRRGKMKKVLKACKKKGKDIFLIKIFGGGKIMNIEKAVRYGLRQRFADGIDLGMNSKEELDENLKIINVYFRT